jgi:hypothetical protein
MPPVRARRLNSCATMVEAAGQARRTAGGGSAARHGLTATQVLREEERAMQRVTYADHRGGGVQPSTNQGPPPRGLVQPPTRL